MSAKLWKAVPSVLEGEYDFAVSGGAISAIKLMDLPDGFHVHQVDVKVETPLAGAGAVATLGEDGAGDVDGYHATTLVGVAAGAVKGDGALVSGGLHSVDATKDGLSMDITVGALTAGKFKVYVSGYQA